MTIQDNERKIQECNILTHSELNKLITEHYSYLTTFARKLTKSNDETADLVQQTVLKIMEKKHLFDKTTNFKAWSSTVLRNEFLSRLRKNGRIVNEDIHTFDNVLEDMSNKNAVNQIQENELSAIVKTLPKFQRDLLSLHSEGLSMKELSNRFGLPEGTIKSAVSRIKHNIHKIMKYNEKQSTVSIKEVDPQEKEIIKLHKQGKNIKEIHQITGYPKYLIMDKIYNKRNHI